MNHRLTTELPDDARRSNVFGPEGFLVSLVGAILLEHNDEWAVQRARHVALEPIASLCEAPFNILSGVVA